jgi:hypothetical protein
MPRNIVEATTQHNTSDSEADIKMKARGRLKNLRQWMDIRGWGKELPEGHRGDLILRWGADHAWLAAEHDWRRERSVRNWCLLRRPKITATELAELVADTAISNKRWTDDQSAAVLEIGWRDRETHRLWFIGADDDPGYENRDRVRLEKAAAHARNFRAAHSTGAKPGRPGLQLSAEEKLVRSNAQAAERMRRHRASRKNASRDMTEFSVTGEPRPTASVTLNPVSTLTLTTLKIVDTNIGDMTGFSVTDLRHDTPAAPSGAHKAPPRSHGAAEDPEPSAVALDARPASAPRSPTVVIRLDTIPDGLIINEDGAEFAPAPPHQWSRPPKSVMDWAMEGMRGRA